MAQGCGAQMKISELMIASFLAAGLLFCERALAVQHQHEESGHGTREQVSVARSSSLVEDSAEDIAAYEEAFAAYNEAARAKDFDAALDSGLKALELGEKLSTVPPVKLAKLSLNLARLYVLSNRDDEALEMFERSIGHFTAANGKDSAQHYVPMQESTSLAIESHRLEYAETMFRRLSRVVKLHFDYPSGERAGYFLTQASLFKLQIIEGRPTGKGLGRRDLFKLARKAIRNARSDYLAIGDQVGVGNTSFALGKFEWEAGRTQSALRNFKMALAEYKAAGLPPGDERVLRCHTFLAQIYLKGGREEKATPHLQHVGKYQGDMDRDKVVPIFQVLPKYPSRAAFHNTEGWVHVEFTIAVTGKVKDVIVVDSDPEGVFEESAIEAVSQWRYIPMSKDGVLFESKHEVVLTFSLDH